MCPLTQDLGFHALFALISIVTAKLWTSTSDTVVARVLVITLTRIDKSACGYTGNRLELEEKQMRQWLPSVFLSSIAYKKQLYVSASVSPLGQAAMSDINSTTTTP